MSLRLEKGFPSWGLELASDYFPDESGLAKFIATDKPGFCGRDAYLSHKEQGARERIGSFVIDIQGIDAYGGEPIFRGDQLAGYTTSGGYGYRVEQSLALGYLLPEHYQPGDGYQIEILGEKYSAELVDGPVYDAKGLRMKA